MRAGAQAIQQPPASHTQRHSPVIMPPAAMVDPRHARAVTPALEEQRSEKYRHALIAVVSIGVRAGQLGGTDAWLSSRLVFHARICRP